MTASVRAQMRVRERRKRLERLPIFHAEDGTKNFIRLPYSRRRFSKFLHCIYLRREWLHNSFFQGFNFLRSMKSVGIVHASGIVRARQPVSACLLLGRQLRENNN